MGYESLLRLLTSDTQPLSNCLRCYMGCFTRRKNRAWNFSFKEQCSEQPGLCSLLVVTFQLEWVTYFVIWLHSNKNRILCQWEGFLVVKDVILCSPRPSQVFRRPHFTWDEGCLLSELCLKWRNTDYDQSFRVRNYSSPKLLSIFVRTITKTVDMAATVSWATRLFEESFLVPLCWRYHVIWRRKLVPLHQCFPSIQLNYLWSTASIALSTSMLLEICSCFELWDEWDFDGTGMVRSYPFNLFITNSSPAM